MSFCYLRVIRFHETDAAGVVYFANLLTLCHEAYEAALAAATIDLKEFFSDAGETAVPIVHAEADFYQPLFCGDAIAITLIPHQLDPYRFEIAYRVSRQSQTDTATKKPLAQALTRHVCISTGDRRRHPLGPDLLGWIKALSEPAAPAD
ncbi:acyl-CoA thioesterase [Leptolyngbya sp. BC1307]|uniref:acyl-CoA thioesterase n=1 Tax=Leptolyngbya sp. BC1307 TaxID=2029589 RepID=UPI000EFAEE63|nr:acyl-CoA thioesterase [Leptolyngbya sp. BC1307]